MEIKGKHNISGGRANITGFLKVYIFVVDFSLTLFSGEGVSQTEEEGPCGIWIYRVGLWQGGGWSHRLRLPHHLPKQPLWFQWVSNPFLGANRSEIVAIKWKCRSLFVSVIVSQHRHLIIFSFPKTERTVRLPYRDSGCTQEVLQPSWTIPLTHRKQL